MVPTSSGLAWPRRPARLPLATWRLQQAEAAKYDPLSLEQRRHKEKPQHAFACAARVAADFLTVDDVNERWHHANAIVLCEFLVVAYVDRTNSEPLPFQRGDRRLNMATTTSRWRCEVQHPTGIGLGIDLDEFLHIVVPQEEQHTQRQHESHQRKPNNTLIHLSLPLGTNTRFV